MTRFSFLINLLFGTLFMLAMSVLLSYCADRTNVEEHDEGTVEKASQTLFRLLSEKESGVAFRNVVTESPTHNYFKFEYFYNGGGVAVGDINNDGLNDIYFTGNMVEDRLYVNKGELKFEDITPTAIAAGQEGWHTGVTMVDVNADGWLDIYVCRSGWPEFPGSTENLLYINNGDLTFTEEAEKYGLDDERHSTQAAFFDCDKDGDLDAYIMNTPRSFRENLTINQFNQLLESGRAQSDRLMRNEGGTFVDVSMQAGINNHAFGLGLSVADIDEDGFPDIYVANDYDEPDFMYMNQGDGTFKDEIRKRTKHISNFGMGTDIADFNNDQHLDIVELDMAFASHVRSKRNMASMSTEKFWRLVGMGKHFQYMVNTLQLNNGNGRFSEIAQLAGVAKTDWSWAPLFADFDNDGLKDLLVTNGFKRDAKDRDFQANLSHLITTKGQVSFEETMAMMPSNTIANQLFRNTGKLTFEEVSEGWGFTQPINSNGAAYADLDNDGDLDLVINHMDQVSGVYENSVNSNNSIDVNFLQIKVKGGEENLDAIGARVLVQTGEKRQVVEVQRTRGFQSSVDPLVHYGLGEYDMADQVVVYWPDGKMSKQDYVKANQRIEFDVATAELLDPAKPDDPQRLLTQVTGQLGLDYVHRENPFNDFEREILLPHVMSQSGPFMSSGDVNGDGHQDVFVGGAAGSSGVLYMQTANGKFKKSAFQPWEREKMSEDLGSLFFDFDGDGAQDLYVVSGGNEFSADDQLLQDRLYMNTGNGKFKLFDRYVPEMRSSGMRVISSDIDGDGDLDLFVGGRVIPGKYPYPPRSYLLENNGLVGGLKDVTAEYAPELVQPGMVTDCAFVDYDMDGDEDLIIVGEWMPLQVFRNDNGRFLNQTSEAGLNQTNGFWFSVAAGDFDKDGDIDFVAGNMGRNKKFKGSKEKPFNVYSMDFDGNGTNDIVLSSYEKGVHYPVRGRECTSQQMPFISEKFPTYKAFAEADLPTLYTPEKLDEALHLEVHVFESSVALNKGDGTFEVKPLPIEAQFSTVQDFEVIDLNDDGILDLVLTGNLFGAEVETVRYDAGYGLCLIGDGLGNFDPMPYNRSGFYTPGDSKDLQWVVLGPDQRQVILVGNNSSNIQAFELVHEKKNL